MDFRKDLKERRMAEESIFTRIIKREIPAAIVYEDAKAIAFLDITQMNDGHMLVVPKDQVATLDELSSESAAHIGALLPKLAKALKEATVCEGINLLQNNGKLAGQVVEHVHFHLVPRHEGDGLFGGVFKEGAEMKPMEYLEPIALKIRNKL